MGMDVEAYLSGLRDCLSSNALLDGRIVSLQSCLDILGKLFEVIQNQSHNSLSVHVSGRTVLEYN
jgi:hypothetical protein